MILTPKLSVEDQEPLYMQLRHYIVSEIKSSRLQINDRLPSVRQLALHLGLSRNSIENAYNQLLAEGYITSLPKKGYYIADIDILQLNPTSIKLSEKPLEEATEYAYDFKSEYVSQDSFDYRLWKKHLNYVLNYKVDSLYAYGEPKGELDLREVITTHFHRTRGVVAGARQIVIGGGVTPLLTVITKLFNEIEINDIGLEDPGFNKAKSVFDYSHMQTYPIEITQKGIDIKKLNESGVRSCYVSPSHQFPTGRVMPIKNRVNLLNWAESVDGYIIEDDYNSELRYEGQPIPAMQSLDEGERVIYLGSFSTVLAPAIRVSFMVLPLKLIEVYEQNMELYSQTASKLEQLALAHLIESGDFEKHIRKIRTQYAKKQGLVLNCIKKHLPKDIKPSYGKSGLHIMLELPYSWNEEEVVDKCASNGIWISGLNSYRANVDGDHKSILILSYRGIDDLEVEAGIQKLGHVLFAYRSEKPPRD